MFKGFYSDFNFKELENIRTFKQRGKGRKTYNDCIISFDTETSKVQKNATYIEDNQTKYVPVTNIVVAWSLNIMSEDEHIAVLYGNNPLQIIDVFNSLRENLKGHNIYIYVHNLPYDWVFIRRFLIAAFGEPISQLNVKPHRPINIKFENGLILKDSLILSNRSLERWAKDLNVKNRKAVGNWNYTGFKNQNETFSPEELEYIYKDVMVLSECINKTLKLINKNIDSIPLTSTGIVRKELQKSIDNLYITHMRYENQYYMPFQTYIQAEKVYHGGYTHGYRDYVNIKISEEKYGEPIVAYDFASSYPYCMLAYRFPMGKFYPKEKRSLKSLLDYCNKMDMCSMFTLVLQGVRLKDNSTEMPYLQYSKTTSLVNPVLDNGRILTADMLTINITEIDAEIIMEQYTWDFDVCVNIKVSAKDYLPRWLTDFVFDKFKDKTQLKGGDPVLYGLAKAQLNSCYGMSVTKNIKEEIVEDYETGENYIKPGDFEQIYKDYNERITTILAYQWGIYVTAYATRNLFKLGSMCKTWLYSDTDSIYCLSPDTEKIEEYNKQCIDLIKQNGYSGVKNEKDGKIYNLGVAELDGIYSEFKYMGAKRYACRDKETGKLKITVAGVPKSGVKCLDDNIDNFTPGFIFPGTETGKLTHIYNYVEDITQDSNGNWVADSIDLVPCDYSLDCIDINMTTIRKELLNEEYEILYYE